MYAPYATMPELSRGRQVDEEESSFRSSFQRDRDRIIHASAFRRLKHKTQVFVEHEGDNYRTRLTHTKNSMMLRVTLGCYGLPHPDDPRNSHIGPSRPAEARVFHP